MVGELPIGILVVRSCGNLEIGDGFRVPHMGITASTPVEVAWVRQDRYQVLITNWEPDLMAHLHFFKQHIKADTLDAAGCTGEAAGDDFIGETYCFKDLRALV